MNQLSIVQEEKQEKRLGRQLRYILFRNIRQKQGGIGAPPLFITLPCLLISNLYRVMNHLKKFYDIAPFSVSTF